MKKIYIALLALGIIVTACSGDDNKNNSQTEIIQFENSDLIGYWTPKTITRDGRTENVVSGPCDLDVARQFKDNMTTIEYFCTSNDAINPPTEYIGTYTLNGNDVVIDSPEHYILKAKIVELTDNVLKLEFYYSDYSSTEANNNKYTIQYDRLAI